MSIALVVPFVKDLGIGFIEDESFTQYLKKTFFKNPITVLGFSRRKQPRVKQFYE